MRHPLIPLALLIVVTAGIFVYSHRADRTSLTPTEIISELKEEIPVPDFIAPNPSPSPSPLVIPFAHTIPQKTHVFQTFNNCGPASLSMALSYLNMTVSQAEIGQQLRPYQNPQGDNDDKSVTLNELAGEAERRGLLAYHRPNGNPEILKAAIAYDIPVIIRTWLKEGEDIGHYRVVRGYDDRAKTYIQDDSLQGGNLTYSYDQLDRIWQSFNYEYLLVIPPEKQKLVEQILGKNVDEKWSWQQARQRVEQELKQNPTDIYAQFNMSVAAYYLGDYQGSVIAFEKVESRLPSRMSWYQIEPIQAYFALGEYDRVLSLTDKILNNQNRAFSELYLLRAAIFDQRGETTQAAAARALARTYNRNLDSESFKLYN